MPYHARDLSLCLRGRRTRARSRGRYTQAEPLAGAPAELTDAVLLRVFARIDEDLPQLAPVLFAGPPSARTMHEMHECDGIEFSPREPAINVHTAAEATSHRTRTTRRLRGLPCLKFCWISFPATGTATGQRQGSRLYRMEWLRLLALFVSVSHATHEWSSGDEARAAAQAARLEIGARSFSHHATVLRRHLLEGKG